MERIQLRIGTTLPAGEVPYEGEPLWDDQLRRLGFWNTGGQDFDWFRIPATSKGENLSYIPLHQYDANTHMLRFQQAGGEWGEWFDTQGEPGESVQGDPGENGYAAGVQLLYNASTLNQDPGFGKFSFNSLVVNAITTAYISRTDAQGNDATAWAQSFGNVLNATSRGTLHIQQSVGAGRFLELKVMSAPTIYPDYCTYTVQLLAGTLPNDGTPMALAFTPAGADGQPSYTSSSVTFMGNGTVGPYTLPWTPASEDALTVAVTGLMQGPDSFVLAGNQITFGEVITTLDDVLVKNTYGITLIKPDAESIDATMLKTSALAALRTKLDVYNKAYINALEARIAALETP